MDRKIRIIDGIDRIELFGNLDVNLNLIKEATGAEIFQREDELVLKAGPDMDGFSEEEKEQAKKDMGSMLDYIDKLNELDTDGVEPMSHAFPVNNVFREDEVTNGDDRENMLLNAPQKKDGTYMVPKTFD